jgi:glycosyltransferase 2 family protein
LKKNLAVILKFLFFLGIGVLLVWLVVKDKTDAELANIKGALQQANYFWILLSVIISGLSHYFRALRWKILLQPMGHIPKTSNTFFSVMVGYIANLAVPRLGEVTRCGVLSRYEKVPFVQGFGTVIAERALDVICVIVLFFITLGIEFSKISGLANDMIFAPLAGKLQILMQKQLFIICASAVIIIGIAGFYYFRKKIRAMMSGKVKGFVNGLWEGLLSVKKVNKPFLFILHTVLIWLMYILQVYVCFFAFEELSSLSFVVAMVITVFGSLAVVVVPGGTGVYQIIVIQILTTVYMISQTGSFAFAWSVWASQIVLILIAGLLSLMLLPLLNKTEKEAEENLVPKS